MPKVRLFAVGLQRWMQGLAAIASLCTVVGAARADHPREVRMGVYQNEPKIFLNAQQQPSGIFGELALQMAQHHNWTLVPVPCEWKACLESLQNGSIDLMPDVAFTPERAQLFDFHATPALLSWSQIYARPEVPIRSALDLKDRRIAVLQGSVQQEYLRNLMAGFGVQAVLVPVETLQEAFELASRGGADAALANRFFGDLQAPRYKMVSTPVLFQPSQLFFATGKNSNPDLLAAIETSLQAWQVDPRSHYFQVLKRWMRRPR